MTDVDYRAFEPERDFPAVAKLIADTNAHAGHDWFPSVEALTIDWSPTARYEPASDTRIAELDGRVVGAARTSWREREGAIIHVVQLWVHPDAQRRGIGSSLLSWGEAHARAVAATHTGRAAELEHRFGGITSHENAASVAFAEHHGYAPTRFHYEMRRDLAEPIAGAALPDGLEVRPVLPEHHRAIWDADAEAFRDHWDAATVDEDDFARFFAHPDVDPSLWQVAWDGDEIAGSVINGINRGENEQIGLDIGWLDSVSTRRPWRRRGLAAALIARSLAVLRERGMTVAALGVDTESPTGALGVYERAGFRPVKTFAFYRKAF
jgi:GNAT superfamily N-acetyltransferase